MEKGGGVGREGMGGKGKDFLKPLPFRGRGEGESSGSCLLKPLLCRSSPSSCTMQGIQHGITSQNGAHPSIQIRLLQTAVS